MKGTTKLGVTRAKVRTTEQEMRNGKPRGDRYDLEKIYARRPTHMGEPLNVGEVDIGLESDDEGYAVFQCGNTKLKVGHSLLCSLVLRVDSDSIMGNDMEALQRGLYSIACEAGVGRTGEGEFNPKRKWDDPQFCPKCECWFDCICERISA